MEDAPPSILRPPSSILHLSVRYSPIAPVVAPWGLRWTACSSPVRECLMISTVRQRMVHAATVGLVAAAVATAAQYFVAVPVGGQPEWLWTLTMVTAIPSLYLAYPLAGLLDLSLPTRTLVEVSTPFGPALRVAPQDLALVALGTLVIVGLAAYLAHGLGEMMAERH
jgi:hypothetical protein